MLDRNHHYRAADLVLDVLHSPRLLREKVAPASFQPIPRAQPFTLAACLRLSSASRRAVFCCIARNVRADYVNDISQTISLRLDQPRSRRITCKAFGPCTP